MSYQYGYGSAYPAAQQYTTGQYAAAAAAAATQQTAAAATYGYATTQPTRVVAGYQPATYATTGYSAPTVAASTGGYGYFQKAAEPVATAYTALKATSYAVPQATYGYATTVAAPKTSTYAASTGTTYQKPTNYATSAVASTTYPSYAATPKSTVSYDKKPSTGSSVKTSTSAGGANSVHQNAYEKVVYNAATSFLTQQSQQSKGSWTKTQKPQFRLSNQKGGFGSKTGGVAKPQQLHYCEVCKISCGGPQTYKEHLEGQKHKKKAASATTDTSKLPRGTYKCDLCDVLCTGKDAYGAHVKGANHQKVVKLHQKLGKPIPEIVVPEPTAKKEVKVANVVKTTAPKINFVGGNKLLSTPAGAKVEVAGQAAAPAAAGTTDAEMQDDEEEDAEPVGEDHVEEVKSDTGKVIGYKCNLCDCRFNDTVAKAAHVKGRRHRLAYKKKVDPKLQVSLPKSQRNRDSRLKKGAKGGANTEAVWRQRQQEQHRWEQDLRLREEDLRRWEEDEYMRRVGEDRYWTRPDNQQMHELEYYEWERRTKFMDPSASKPAPLIGGPGPMAGGPDDRLVMAKHQLIYPTEEELNRVQSIVGSTEKALKLVSDAISEEDKKAKAEAAPKEEAPKVEEVKEEKAKAKPLMGAKDDRTLKGVMRVGVLAKGLLLKGSLNLELVVLCAEKPTYTLLKKVGKLVPEKLKEVTEDKYNMSISVVQCAIMITSVSEPKTTVKVTLTSPSMREGDEDGADAVPAEEKKPKSAEPKDVLDKEKCLQALAALRHAKWFQARANHIQSCVIVIRIMRELCTRVAAFKPLTGWAVELLCEKSLASYPMPLSPGEAIRRVMETLASGILLGDGPGLVDPCEKDKTDAASNLNLQERETLTSAAQHALRLQAFRQLHKVLEVEALKPMPPSMQRKRPASKSAVGDAVSAAKVAKTEPAAEEAPAAAAK